MDTTIELYPKYIGKLHTAIWFSHISDEAREYIHCDYGDEKNKMWRNRITDANYVTYIEGILPSSNRELKDTDYVRAMLLPALPKKPKPEHIALIYRYMAEGIFPHGKTYGYVEKLGGNVKWLLDMIEGHVDVEITYCTDKESKEGNNVKVAIDG